MKIRTEILHEHPWWHKLWWEHIHEIVDDGKAEDPDTKMPAVTETKTYACSYPNCRYHKVETKIWSDY